MDVPTIERAAHRLRAGQTTSADITEECLRQIQTHNGRLNAFICVMADEARRQARAADRELAAKRDRGPLHGVPISIKDLIDIRGVATTAASRVRDGHIAARDAPIIEHLREAGAVLVGKTNLHEFAFGTTSEDSAFGPVRHPGDDTRSAGGSSGGSAVSVAAGMALGSVGTDTGGSIRIPAAACGIVGFKPAVGEVSVDGVVPLSPTMDHVGPLARTVTDAWHLLHGLLGRAPSPLLPARLSSARLGVPRRYFCEVLDDDVRAVFEAALDSLRAEGARVDEVEIRNASDVAPIYLHLVFSEAAAYHAATLEAMPERYTPPVRERLETARYVLAEDYVRALTGRAALIRQVNEVLTASDALVLPTLPIPAPPLGAARMRAGQDEHPLRSLMLRLTQLFNMTGHPAVSVPCGQTPAGLPCGLQLVGNDTGSVMRLALACERHLGG